MLPAGILGHDEEIGSVDTACLNDLWIYKVNSCEAFDDPMEKSCLWWFGRAETGGIKGD